MKSAQGGKGLAAALVVGGLLCVTGLRAEEAAEGGPITHEPEVPVARPPLPGTIQVGMTVQIEYTLTVDGAVVDSTDGQDPLSYVHGQGDIIQGLEEQLAGLRAGDVKEIIVKPGEGYGEINPLAIVEMPGKQLPRDLVPEVGMELRGVDQTGRPFRGRIRDVTEKHVTLDLNHPLAGKTLNFIVKVVDVAPMP